MVEAGDQLAVGGPGGDEFVVSIGKLTANLGGLMGELGELGLELGGGVRGAETGLAPGLLAERFRDRLQLQPNEVADDAIQGCLGVALRRASLFGRAPTIHDFTVAFTIWGFLDPSPPQELVDLRRPMFAGVRHAVHYAEARAIASFVPEATLRRPHGEVVSAYPAAWRELLGV